MTPGRRPILPISLGASLVLLTLAAYLPALQCSFIWDDDQYVTRNATLRSLEGLGRIWFEIGAVPQYYPLVHTTFWCEYQLWGLAPLGYHLVNILLHGSAAVLFWRLLLRLRMPGAWLAAAVFALHPVHVESVAWVTERKNVLAVVMALASVLAWLRFDPLDPPAPAPQPDSPLPPLLPAADASTAGRRRWYVLAVLLFVLAMFSKTVSCSVPAVLLLLIYWKRGRVQLRDAMRLAPMFIVGLGLGLLTVWIEKHHVGAQGEKFDLSLIDRCLIAGRALWFYAAKLVWPTDLSFIYPRWAIDSAQPAQYAFPLTFLALLGTLLAMRRRLGRGPLVAVLIFAGVLVPALGFFDIYPMKFSFVADHFQYLASLGLIALLCSAAARLTRAAPRAVQRIAAVLAASLLALLGTLTWQQCHHYRNADTLWLATFETNPNGFIVQHHTANALAKQGDLHRAVALHYQALLNDPLSPQIHTSLGMRLMHLQRWREAEFHLQRALEILPIYNKAHNTLGLLYLRTDREDMALASFERALSHNPGEVTARMNIALLLRRRGQNERAFELYNEALQIARFWQDMSLVEKILAQMDTARSLDSTRDFDP